MTRNVSLPLLCLSFCSAVFAVSGPAKHIGLEDVFQLRTVASPEISPDGKRIVYVVNFADIQSDSRYSNLWIVNFDGSGNRPITSGNHHDSSPKWSPDGSRLAFTSDREGSAQIFEWWPDSGQITRMTNLTEGPGAFSWSPDGKQIAFLALQPEKPRKLGNLPVPPEGAKWADPARIIDRMVYRFDQVGYLKPGYTQLFVMSTDGQTPRQISSGHFNLGGPGGGGGSAPVWSPDCKSIILSANRHDDAEYDPVNTEVYEFSVADGSVKALTDRKGPDGSPVLSKDGRRIAYTGFDDQHQGYQVSKLSVMFRDGSKSRVLTESLDRDVQSPRWSPDGRGVYFIYTDEGDAKLGYAPLDGRFRKVADHLGSAVSSYGGGDAFSISDNGRFATTVNGPDNPGDIAVGQLDREGTTTVTHVNHDLLEQRQIGQVEELWFNSSKDGRKIQGWIIKPPDFDSSRKYPMILEIHGGPFASYGGHFDYEKQALAAKGYVVLYTNPRGSTSYGGEFGNLIHHAYPGDDFYDLNSGVDAVVAKGYIDPDNVFVTGGSGGGVLTCWMIGRSKRFRAAASLYPVINWYSWIGTADIGSRMVSYWFAGAPWESTENLQNYEQRSLLSVVKNVQTPTLVMTGEEDYRTPIEEAEQYYRALKLLKVESVLVRVPGEGHGISRRPSHQMAKVAYISDWFDQHKKQ
jgi:acylaminoacyl-peptidase